MKLLNIIEFVAALVLMFMSLAVGGVLGLFMVVISLASLICIALDLFSAFRSLNKWGECTQCGHKVFEIGFEKNGETYVPKKDGDRWLCIKCANPSLRRG